MKKCHSDLASIEMRSKLSIRKEFKNIRRKEREQQEACCLLSCETAILVFLTNFDLKTNWSDYYSNFLLFECCW